MRIKDLKVLDIAYQELHQICNIEYSRNNGDYEAMILKDLTFHVWHSWSLIQRKWIPHTATCHHFKLLQDQNCYTQGKFPELNFEIKQKQ